MNSITQHPLHDHTWKDIGGPIGLVLDGVFCAFVIVAAFGMLVFASVILFVDYLTSPVLALVGKLRSRS